MRFPRDKSRGVTLLLECWLVFPLRELVLSPQLVKPKSAEVYESAIRYSPGLYPGGSLFYLNARLVFPLRELVLSPNLVKPKSAEVYESVIRYSPGFSPGKSPFSPGKSSFNPGDTFSHTNLLTLLTQQDNPSKTAILLLPRS